MPRVDTPESLDAAVERLRKLGLFAETYTGTVSWLLIRGGRRVIEGEIRGIEDPFQVAWMNERYVVRFAGQGQLTDEVPFEGLLDAVEFIAKKWGARAPV